MQKIKSLLTLLALLFGLLSPMATPAIVLAAPLTQTKGWTDDSCRGADAIVIDEEKNGAIRITDTWGCAQPLPSNKALLFVEPHTNGTPAAGFNVQNANAACLANSWKDAQNFGERAHYGNGSFWVVDVSLAQHPLVVNCNAVASSDTMGLNPSQNQELPERETWMKDRASALLAKAPSGQFVAQGVSDPMPAYCASQHAGEGLSRYLCAGVSPQTLSQQAAAQPTPAPTSNTNGPNVAGVEGWLAGNWGWLVLVGLVVAVAVFMGRRGSTPTA